MKELQTGFAPGGGEQRFTASPPAGEALDSPFPAGAAPSGECHEFNDGSVGAEPAHDYNAAFFRQSGWTGADGTYSIKLRDGRTLWLFSDTLIGRVDAAGHRALDRRIPVNPGGYRFINNSIAIQDGNDPGGIRFITGNNDGVPGSVFTPQDEDEWFWVNGAVRNTDNSVTILLNSFTTSDDSRFAFGKQTALWAVDLLVWGDEICINNYRRISAVDPVGSSRAKETVWGAGMLQHGAWTYIYGSRLPADSLSMERSLVIARTPTGEVGNSDAWRFYNGKEFVRNNVNARALPLPVSNEFSIQQLWAGCYVLAFADGYGPVGLSFSGTPIGPWSTPRHVWKPVEATDSVYTYNAKAHPALSDTRGLLISYNVNSYDVHESLVNADIYRPRFVRVPWEMIQQMAEQSVDSAMTWQPILTLIA